MNIFRSFFKRWHIYISWAILSVIFWGWIFTLLTDTVVSKKLTVFVHAYECQDMEMAKKLEETKPEGISMIKVHPFSYALFGETGFTGADVYLIPESEVESYISDFTPIQNYCIDHTEYEYYFGPDGSPYGIKIYDADTGEGIAKEYLTYDNPYDSDPPEDVYLFVGANSAHIGTNEDEDQFAFNLIDSLMSLK